MMGEPKIEVSENLTGLQVDLYKDGHSDQSLADTLYFPANTIAVDTAFITPSPTPHFTYTTASLPFQPDKLSGLIVDRMPIDGALITRTDVTSSVKEKYPWLPVIESGQLQEPVLRENFIVCVTALHELNSLRTQTLTRHALIDFHSRYKLVILAHNQPGYRKIGPFVAQINQWENLQEFFIIYRKKLMDILQQPASRENHVNVMMHAQGYFNRQTTAEQRRKLCDAIHTYRLGHLPLSVPLAELKKCLTEYPNSYLMTQQYFHLYPNNFYLD